MIIQGYADLDGDEIVQLPRKSTFTSFLQGLLHAWPECDTHTHKIISRRALQKMCKTCFHTWPISILFSQSVNHWLLYFISQNHGIVQEVRYFSFNQVLCLYILHLIFLETLSDFHTLWQSVFNYESWRVLNEFLNQCLKTCYSIKI